jgi:hypothetical protein
MEEVVNKLDYEISNTNPIWQYAISVLDDSWRLLREDLKKTVLYFGYDVSASTDSSQNRWKNLEDQVYHLFGDLDRVGLSEIIGEVVKRSSNLLGGDFSYFSAKDFRRFEESLVRDLEIPDQAWDRFWRLVDERKDNLIREMERFGEDYNFREHLFPSIAITFREGPGSPESMSFKWSLGTIVGVGTLLGSVNGSAAIATAGLSLLSFLAAAAAAGYAAGRQ